MLFARVRGSVPGGLSSVTVSSYTGGPREKLRLVLKAKTLFPPVVRTKVTCWDARPQCAPKHQICTPGTRARGASALAWGVAGTALALWAPQAPEPGYKRLAPSGAAVAPRLLWCARLSKQHRAPPPPITARVSPHRSPQKWCCQPMSNPRGFSELIGASPSSRHYRAKSTAPSRHRLATSPRGGD
eukprot:gene24692-biopygen10457